MSCDGFASRTPETRQQVIAEQELMAHLEEHKLWARASDVWRCGLLPEGALLRHNATNAFFFVVKRYAVAMLTWPATRSAVNLWSFDQSASSLLWRFCFAFDEYDEVPLEYTSPLRLRLEDRVVYII
jgi:hypothetical protein